MRQAINYESSIENARNVYLADSCGKEKIPWLRISISVKNVVQRSILKQRGSSIIAQCTRGTRVKLAARPLVQRLNLKLITAKCIPKCKSRVSLSDKEQTLSVCSVIWTA